MLDKSNNPTYLPTQISAEQLALLQSCIVGGDWQTIIDFANQDKVKSHPNVFGTYLYSVYQFVLEYAISLQAHKFIEATILHDEVVSHIDHSLLLKYSQSRNEAFQDASMAAMVNNPASDGLSFFCLDRVLLIACREFFNKDVSSQSDATVVNEQFIRRILLNPQIKNKKNYLIRWVEAYYQALSTSSNREATNNCFYSLIPPEKESVKNLLTILVSNLFVNPLTTTLVTDDLNSFISKFGLNCEDIIEVLESDDVNSCTISYLEVLISKIPSSHPKYERYKLICELLKVEPGKRARFILQHPKMISSKTISENLQYHLINTGLNSVDRKILLQQYIDHDDVDYGSRLGSHVLEYDEGLVAKYMSASHTFLPSEMLATLVFKSTQYLDLSKLINILISRANYSFSTREIIGPLFSLFSQGLTDAVAVLLNNPSVFNLLKQYYVLRGDDSLPHRDRGTLMSSVVAWYIPSGKCYELFSSFPEETRKELLKAPVLKMIDPNLSNLYVKIIQSGQRDLIEAVGGLQPRFIISSSSMKMITMPHFWKNPRVLHVLRNFQRKKAVDFAVQRESQLKNRLKLSEFSLEMAKKAVSVFDIKALQLLHQTTFNNSTKILLAGVLQTRHHIEGHLIEGRRSQGLGISDCQTKDAASVFCFFTRKPLTEDIKEGLTQFSKISQAQRSSFLISLPKLLAANSQINFLYLGPSNCTHQKTLSLPCDYVLTSDPTKHQEGTDMVKVSFNRSEDVQLVLYQKLFEIVFEKIIKDLPQAVQVLVIEKLTNPQSQADRKLACDLLDFLNLEWLIPGNIHLKLSYVERIEHGENVYDLLTLRQTCQHASELQVLAAIDAVGNIEKLPFLVKEILPIALQRNHKNVVKKLLHLKITVSQEIATTFYPSEIYQIESLVQLILEDLNNDRIYVHYTGDAIIINSTSNINSNRNGSHHAEMAKLYCALGLGDLHGKNALEIVLGDTLKLTVGETGQFKTLGAIRDALLTYELTTLLVSQQNLQHYQNNNGTFHPVTGKGANNGVVALLPERLFVNKNPYAIQVTCDQVTRSIYITTNKDNTSVQIVATLCNVLDIDVNKTCMSNNGITLKIPATELIAKLRRTAIFYEGLNVITDEGRILLANRRGKGLASAGGHHSDKYNRQGIAYGLRSEFGLTFKNPREFERSVELIQVMQAISKTGIYIIQASDLIRPEKNKFRADPDEFIPGSEVGLTLTEMRGKEFYDVMPLADICRYQLNVLKQYLHREFLDFQDVKLLIDDTVDKVVVANVLYKVPAETFGRITLTCSILLPDRLKQIFENFGKFTVDGSKFSCVLDESPMVILQTLKANLPSRLVRP